MRRLVVLFSAAACAVALLAGAEALPTSAAGTPSCGGQAATLIGTAKRDRLIGTPGDDVILALDGGDVIRGRGGNDVICGSRGSDKLVGGDGDDELRGGPSGITRGDGEVIYHRDLLVPGSGDDVLVPGYDGGGDEYRWDTLSFSGSPNGIVADVAADTIAGEGMDVVVGDHYAILGSPYDDVITGSDADDTIFGGAGADRISGGAGNDSLYDWGAVKTRLATTCWTADRVTTG